MYRLIIIDDEQVVREGIAEKIDWADLGFELVAACRDGREGLAHISQQKPDVVITDICMPFIDGLELAGAIAEELPRTKTILLTGYDEFEYAREAVKLKVHDFLLKPITASELSEMLARLRTQLDAERDRRRKFEQLEEQLRTALPVYRERLLNRLVGANSGGSVPEAALELLELSLPGPRFVTMICDLEPSVDDAYTDDHLAGMALQNSLSALAETEHDLVSFSTPSEEAGAIISLDGPEMGRTLELAEQIAEQCQQEVGRTISIGIGGVAAGIEELPKSFSEARTALEHRFVLGSDQIITIQQVRGDYAPPTPPNESEPRGRYAHAVRVGIPHDALSELREIVSTLRESGDDMDHVHVVMNQLLAETISSFNEMGVEYREISSLGTNPFAKFGRIKTLEEMEQWFIDVLDDAKLLIDSRQQSQSQTKALAAKEFISSHYMESDVSLKRVCRALSVSKSYLSAAFKEQTGMTLVEYLTEVRVDQAKVLLSSTDQKIYEVAAAVGFRDAHYFSMTFRKQTGQTPTEFREFAWRSAPL
jgi:two-component system response regulator YesN